MRQASISTANDYGYTGLETISGRIFILMLNVEAKPWMLLEYYHTLTAYSVMTIGSRITNTAVNMHYAMLIIFVNWSGQQLKTNKHGQVR